MLYDRKNARTGGPLSQGFFLQFFKNQKKRAGRSGQIQEGKNASFNESTRLFRGGARSASYLGE